MADLQDRLAFMYRWACEGPPVVVSLGMLAKPKAYLTCVLQVGHRHAPHTDAHGRTRARGARQTRACVWCALQVPV